MARYNGPESASQARRIAATSPIRTVGSKPTAITATGGPGFINDTYGECFRLGVSLFAGKEDTYHEGGRSRDNRFADLVGVLAVNDPKWTLDFLRWLRSTGNIRTASVLGAVSAIHARLEAGETASPNFNRAFAAQIPQRLDEVPELFAIWRSLFPGELFPQPLKRGAGDALRRLANEYSMMKYNTGSHHFQIADVLSIAHVKPTDEVMAQLFAMALANRYGAPYETGLLDMVQFNIELRAEVAAGNYKRLLDPQILKRAGMTWEDALSLAGNKVPKADLWEALILGGSLGYMAMLRNLRNFQEAGISKEATRYVQERLADPVAVSKSRQLPFRFWAAYQNATGAQWMECLETALGYSVSNVPVFEGPTVALIDTSGSMGPGFSTNSTVSRSEQAALFAGAVALRNPDTTDLYMFADSTARVSVRKGDSLLRLIADVRRRNGQVGHGTQTARSVKATYNGHRRVMVFTDMQSFGGYGVTSDHVNPGTWVYHWDLSGYKHGDIPSGVGRTHQLSGLTDATMRTIPLLEMGAEAKWPWQK